MSSTTKSSARTERIGLRATPEQAARLKQAAEIEQKSLTDFILDSACAAAETTVLDQRVFMVAGKQYDEFLELLDRPAQRNKGLDRLFNRVAPWEE